MGVNFIATASASLGTWVNEKNALAAYDGLYRNRLWEAWIILNRDNPKFSSLFLDSVRAYSVFTMFSRVEYILTPERVSAYAKGFFPDPRGPYFYAALLLAVLNLAQSVKSAKAQLEAKNRTQQNPSNAPLKQPVPTPMGRFLVVVSQTTPYLLIITNVAVNVIQIQRGESSAWIEQAFTGISLINISSWKPKNYEWYRDTVLGYPVAATAIYYADNKLRFIIIYLETLKTQFVQKLIADQVALMKKNFGNLGR